MDQTEFEQYIDQYGGDILSFCHYLTKNHDEAEDLCQDCFVQGFRSRNTITGSDHVKPFLLSVAIRLWQNRKRKFAWRKRISESKKISLYSGETIACNPSEQTLLKEKDSIVREAVARLDEKKRVVVLLFYKEELKDKEIAEILHIPVGTVKSRLNLAKKELAAIIEEYEK